MAQKRATLYQLLRQTAEAERTLAYLWDSTRQAASRGSLPPNAGALVDALTGRLHIAQMALYQPIVSHLQSLPSAVSAELISRVPRPLRFPLISNEGSSTASPAIRTSGLGVLPAIAGLPPAALFATVVLALGVTALVLYTFFVTTEFFGDLVMDIEALRADSADAQRRITEQSRRFDECRRAGGSPEACSAQFPIPAPTRFFAERQENRPSPSWLVGLAWVGGITAVAGLLYVGVRAYRSSSPTAVSRRVMEVLP